MKIGSIQMEEFGPYVSELIDFADLNAQRVFLLEGKTGSGKSTIIEGIVFALYGKDSKGRDMETRRNSAPDGSTTRVTLVFEIEGRTYKIVREPMQEKEGRKDPLPHSVSMVELDDEGVAIAGESWSAIREVEAQIAGLVRLDHGQFTSIAVLPQGKFDRFLKSKVDERQDLLEKIFPVGHWKRMVNSIRERAKIAKDNVSALKHAALQRAFSTRKWIDIENKGALETIDEAKSIQTEANDKLDLWEGKIEENSAKLEKKRELVEKKGRRLKAQTEMNNAIEDRKSLLKTKEELGGGKEHIESQRTNIKRHHEATRIEPVLTQRSRTERNLEHIEKGIGAHIRKHDIDAEYADKKESQVEELAASAADTVSKIGAVQQLQESLDAARAVIPSIQKSLTDSEAALAEMTKAQNIEMAKTIASMLEEGKPCLVCGSTHHPHPAHGEEEDSSSEGLRNAKDAREQAFTKLSNANGDVERLKGEVTKSREDLLVKDGDDLPDDTKAREYELGLRELGGLLRDKATAADSLDQASTDWEQIENPYSLNTKEKIEGAMLEPVTLTKTTEQVREFDTSVGVNDKGLAEKRIVDAEGQMAQDIDEDTKTHVDAEVGLAEEDRTHKNMVDALTGLKTSVNDLGESITSHDELSESSKDLIWVDKHLRGTAGKLPMHVVTWLLRVWFNKVLQEANARLLMIGGGRYSLEMAQSGKARSNARVGLDIGVIDALSSSLDPRSPDSLSGGESFYISLALALGMSDVVSQEAGGVRLGTLFIDEGFGSLDQETLDEVLAIIDEVGEHDRVIGLISHVEALKQRIHSRIEVTKKGDGTSSVEVIA